MDQPATQIVIALAVFIVCFGVGGVVSLRRMQSSQDLTSHYGPLMPSHVARRATRLMRLSTAWLVGGIASGIVSARLIMWL